MKEITYPIRLNKYLAYKGFCSRREADTLIESGKIYVNGKVGELGYMVQKDDVVDLHRGYKKEYLYFAYYKPRGVVTHSPQKDEVDVCTSINRNDVFPVGRLDKDSEGLLLLTNDGRVTEKLLSPEACVEKEYVATVDKELSKNVAKRMSQGVNIEGYVTKPAVAKILAPKKIAITLTEGKRHQIRRMLAALGYTTTKLRRVRVGTVRLETLKENQLRSLTGRELEIFKTDLGID